MGERESEQRATQCAQCEACGRSESERKCESAFIEGRERVSEHALLRKFIYGVAQMYLTV